MYPILFQKMWFTVKASLNLLRAGWVGFGLSKKLQFGTDETREMEAMHMWRHTNDKRRIPWRKWSVGY